MAKTRTKTTPTPQPLPLGEIVAWELPPCMRVRQTDLAAALVAAGLDPAAARALCPRFAFIRAVRKLAADKIIGNLEEFSDVLTFQFTGERRAADRLEYDFEAKVSLDLTTYAVKATDPAIEAAVLAELAKCLEERKVQDVTRLIKGLFAANADLFPIKLLAGVYFVPQRHVGFVEKVEKFVAAVGGRMPRFPIADGTPQGAAAAQGAVADFIGGCIDEYEAAIKDLRGDTSDKAIQRAWDKVNLANTKIEDYRVYLGGQAAILEDHVAYVAMLLRKAEAEKAAAKAAAQGSGLVVVTSGPAPSVVAVCP